MVTFLRWETISGRLNLVKDYPTNAVLHQNWKSIRMYKIIFPIVKVTLRSLYMYISQINIIFTNMRMLQLYKFWL